METSFSSTHIDPALTTALGAAAVETRIKPDAYGNRYLWATLAAPTDLPAVAALLKQHAARLCTITALNLKLYEDPVICLNYHFDVAGAIITVAVTLDPTENTVPTITPHFINADWCERECAELYDLHVAGNTNPERLFLDDSINEGILNEIIPLSIMMNGACTTDMWEHITALNLNAEPHSVFPQPEGPAEVWPPKGEHTPFAHASPLPEVTDELEHRGEKKPASPPKADSAKVSKDDSVKAPKADAASAPPVDETAAPTTDSVAEKDEKEAQA